MRKHFIPNINYMCNTTTFNKRFKKKCLCNPNNVQKIHFLMWRTLVIRSRYYKLYYIFKFFLISPVEILINTTNILKIQYSEVMIYRLFLNLWCGLWLQSCLLGLRQIFKYLYLQRLCGYFSTFKIHKEARYWSISNSDRRYWVLVSLCEMLAANHTSLSSKRALSKSSEFCYISFYGLLQRIITNYL